MTGAALPKKSPTPSFGNMRLMSQTPRQIAGGCNNLQACIINLKNASFEYVVVPAKFARM